MKFERLSVCPNAVLPVRSTANSAGYDFSALSDTLIPPYQIMLIPTGIKAQIDKGYYLQLALRSSTPMKKHLMLANGIGIIDSDYYNNPDNEGHMFIALKNEGDKVFFVEKGGILQNLPSLLSPSTGVNFPVIPSLNNPLKS